VEFLKAQYYDHCYSLNDIANVSNILQLILIADGTNLFAFHRDLNTLVQLVNCELELINICFKVNRLSLNVDKTVFIVFTIVSRLLL